MKITKISVREHMMFPVRVEVDHGLFRIDPNGYQESESNERHEDEVKDFIDYIYANKPKGMAVAMRDYGFFEYVNPANCDNRMYSKRQLIEFAKSYKLSKKEHSLDGVFYYLNGNGDNFVAKKTLAYKHVETNIVMSDGSIGHTSGYLGNEVYTNGEGVYFISGHMYPYVFFGSKEAAEHYVSQDAFKKMANDAWSQIVSKEQQEKAAEEKARREAAEAHQAAWKAKEAERLSKVNKDSLVLNTEDIVLGNCYATLIDGKPVYFMAAGYDEQNVLCGVYQSWSGSCYDESLNAEMRWIQVDGQIFASTQDARDYTKLLK